MHVVMHNGKMKTNEHGIKSMMQLQKTIAENAKRKRKFNTLCVCVSCVLRAGDMTVHDFFFTPAEAADAL